MGNNGNGARLRALSHCELNSYLIKVEINLKAYLLGRKTKASLTYHNNKAM